MIKSIFLAFVVTLLSGARVSSFTRNELAELPLGWWQKWKWSKFILATMKIITSHIFSSYNAEDPAFQQALEQYFMEMLGLQQVKQCYAVKQNKEMSSNSKAFLPMMGFLSTYNVMRRRKILLAAVNTHSLQRNISITGFWQQLWREEFQTRR